MPRLLLLLLLAGWLAACGGSTPTPAPTRTPMPPTFTPAPTETAAPPTATPTPKPGRQAGQLPNGTDCPNGYPVKGALARTGERIYFGPSLVYYRQTKPLRCFRSDQDAEGEGFVDALKTNLRP